MFLDFLEYWIIPTMVITEMLYFSFWTLSLHLQWTVTLGVGNRGRGVHQLSVLYFILFFFILGCFVKKIHMLWKSIKKQITKKFTVEVWFLLYNEFYRNIIMWLTVQFNLKYGLKTKCYIEHKKLNVQRGLLGSFGTEMYGLFQVMYSEGFVPVGVSV